MGKSNQQISEFSLEGRFLGFVFKDGYKIKYLRLAARETECWVKVSKALRSSIQQELTPGDWIQVSGEQELNWKTGKLKLKADEIELPKARLEKENTLGLATTKVDVAPVGKRKATVLVCEKSDCCKRGAKEVCQALAQTLRDRGLADQVTIKGTGCMDRCKAGPNIVVMPDKTRYSRIDASEIPGVIEKHFGSESACETMGESAAAVRMR